MRWREIEREFWLFISCWETIMGVIRSISKKPPPLPNPTFSASKVIHLSSQHEIIDKNESKRGGEGHQVLMKATQRRWTLSWSLETFSLLHEEELGKPSATWPCRSLRNSDDTNLNLNVQSFVVGTKFCCWLSRPLALPHVVCCVANNAFGGAKTAFLTQR